MIIHLDAPVAQMDRASASGAECTGSTPVRRILLMFLIFIWHYSQPGLYRLPDGLWVG